MITNNRTLTAVTFCGAVLAVSLVSQPGHAGVALNGVALNGTNLNGTGMQGTNLNGLRQLGTAANSAAPTETSGKRVLAVELPPAAD